MKISLSKNEKTVLIALLDDGRAKDSDIATKINITTQAVGKIRKKLENIGLIKSYTCNIDFEKIGLNCFVLSLIKYRPGVWERLSHENIKEYIRTIPGALVSFMPAGSDVDLVVLYSFESGEEKDRYLEKVKVNYSDIIEYLDSYHFSNYNFLNNGENKNAIKAILNGSKIAPSNLPKKVKKILMSKELKPLSKDQYKSIKNN